MQAFLKNRGIKHRICNPGPLHEMWSTPIDLYCERVTVSFWAEPLNALSNIAFLIAAYAALDLWRREGKNDPVTALLQWWRLLASDRSRFIR